MKGLTVHTLWTLTFELNVISLRGWVAEWHQRSIALAVDNSGLHTGVCWMLKKSIPTVAVVLHWWPFYRWSSDLWYMYSETVAAELACMQGVC